MTEYILTSDEEIERSILNNLVVRALFMLDKNTPSDEGTDYKPLYYGLNKGVTAIINNATTYEQAIAALKQLQCAAEDAYIEQGDR